MDTREAGTNIGKIMKPEELKYAASVLLAAAEGKQIQFINSTGKLENCDHVLNFNLPISRYRIKPELKEAWVNYHDDIISAAHEDRDTAIRCRHINGKTVHMREVEDGSGE